MDIALPITMDPSIMKTTNKAAGRPNRHPGPRARLVRTFRFLDGVPGWRRIAMRFAEKSGEFEVANEDRRFAGDVTGYVDRSVYLFGGYDDEQIRAFISACPRRGTVLDVGGNCGTHSLAFAAEFGRVISFEPNEDLWEQFERNVALNGVNNIELHRIGLGDEDAWLDLRRARADNRAIGTFVSTFEGQETGVAKPKLQVRKFDDAFPDLQVDAVKIDVEGFEANVLRGMRGMLARCRPTVWVEIGQVAVETLGSTAAVAELFPYPVRMLRFEVRWFCATASLVPQPPGPLPIADYVVVPA